MSSAVQSQHKKMKIVEDPANRNLILYTPKEYIQSQTKPKPVPDSIKIIDKKINKYRHAIEEAIKK